jgi:hypothetical protein
MRRSDCRKRRRSHHNARQGLRFHDERDLSTSLVFLESLFFTARFKILQHSPLFVKA